MKLAELNGYEARVPTTGGKAGKGRAQTGTIQVLKDGVIVKQFRFVWADENSRVRAARQARHFMMSNAMLGNAPSDPGTLAAERGHDPDRR